MFKNYIYFCCHKFRLWSIIGSNVRRKIYIIGIFLALFSCTEEIDKSNCYTFTGETVADYLQNRSDKYSHFISLLERANLLGLLSTYGQYTLFLPNNDAVEKYIQEQDSIYHATKDSDNPIWTGITSPLFEDLSDSMANAIARMHLIEKSFRTAEFGEGAISKWNFQDRMLSINYKVEDERFYIMLNNDAAIIEGDNQVENGIVHIIDKPIDPHYKTISNQIGAHSYFSIFSQAIAATGFDERVSQSVDPNYDYTSYITKNVEKYIPKQRYIKFIAFIEPDEVFHKNGIHSLDDLKTFAEKWYGTEEKGNYNNPKNALYKFVAYHFVEGEIPYNRVVLSRSGVLDEEYFDNYYIPGFDLYNYYVTMQGTIVKALKPLSTNDGLNIYLNYSKRTIPHNYEMRNHTNVRIIELTEFTQMNECYVSFVPNAGNGLIHPIDKILIYNEDEMVGNILNERMRFDFASLQPELSSNNILHNEYADLPIGYCKGIEVYEGSSSGFYYPLYNGYSLDCIFFGLKHDNLHNVPYDPAFLLPPVPPRTYEIRISVATSPGYDGNRVLTSFQPYFDNKICCNPILTHTIVSDPEIGWIADSDTYDNGLENDKALRNKGWMKAPDSYNSNINNKIAARNDPWNMRRIIHRQYIDNGEHWLRFRFLPAELIKGFSNPVIRVDYIELVPLHIVNDPTKPEDRH